VNYTLTIADSAERELDSLPKSIRKRVAQRIVELRPQPRPHGSIKLKNSQNLYRIRIGDYRAIYSINDVGRVVDIVRIRHRRNAYD